MIKLIIFDLDGVLVEAKKIHYETLNKSLEIIDKSYMISWDEHINKYDGLKTNQKLEMLTSEKGLPLNFHKQIWENKQKLTIDSLNNLSVNNDIK